MELQEVEIKMETQTKTYQLCYFQFSRSWFSSFYWQKGGLFQNKFFCSVLISYHIIQPRYMVFEVHITRFAMDRTVESFDQCDFHCCRDNWICHKIGSCCQQKKVKKKHNFFLHFVENFEFEKISFFFISYKKKIRYWRIRYTYT